MTSDSANVDEQASHQGHMVREGFELQQMPLTSLIEYQTSFANLFGVTHMGVCQLERENWHLDIHGLVERPCRLNWRDLQQFPSRELVAVHECAGNPLLPTEPVRRVGNVVWQGVALVDVLRELGVLSKARYMWSTGADRGIFNQMQHRQYQKDLSLETVFNGNVLLATHLNGELLSVERGAPVRLVVPDFYGTNSTKWLVSLEFQEQRSPAYFAKKIYNEEVDGELRPVWDLAPHAVFVSHAENQQIQAGECLIWGWAWGAGGVAEVEWSADAGASWQQAEIEARQDHAWQKFSFSWFAKPGAQGLLCRARNHQGQVQPELGARNCWHKIALHVT